MYVKMLPKNQEASQHGIDDCVKCGGLGWILSKINDDENGLLMYAEHCPNCRESRRASADNGIPLCFYDADISKFNFDIYSVRVERLKKISYSFLMDFEKWRINNKGLYLWSKIPGSGKTFLACCLARSVSIKHDIPLRFISVPDYLARISESYKRETGADDMSEIYRTCELLILDDAGSEKKGDWQRAELFRIIDKRTSNGLITIITSNYRPEGIPTADDRIIDRILRSSIVIEMPEESIRSKLAEEEQERFLNDLSIR